MADKRRKFTATVTYRIEVEILDPLPTWYTEASFRRNDPKGIKSIARKELMAYLREHTLGMLSSNGAVTISRRTKGKLTNITEE